MDMDNPAQGQRSAGRGFPALEALDDTERRAVRQSVFATIVLAALIAAGVAGLSALGVQLPDDGTVLAMTGNPG
jgi:hypothetical protein